MMTPQVSLSTRAWSEMLLLASIWGASFVSIRVALDEIGFATIVLHRVAWASLVLWAFVLLRRLPLPRDPKTWGAFLVMGLLNNVLPFGLMAWGQLHIESGLTAIFNSTTAIFGLLLAAVFFADERLTPKRLAGVSLGLIGVVTAIGFDSVLSFDLRSLAQLAVLAGTVCYALASIWARKMLTGLTPQVAAAGMLSASTLICLPFTLMIDGVPSFDLTTTTWSAIGYVSIIATAGAYLLYYRVLAMAGAGNLMLVTLLVVPFAIVLGALLRSESLPVNAYLGFALLAGGLLLVDGRILRLIDRAPRPG